MTGLKDLQEQFQNFVLENQEAFENQVTDLDKTDGRSGMNVYQNGYYLRLLEVLELDYPILLKMVGEKQFDDWGRAYIKTYPSSRFTVRHFGQNFDKFLANQSSAEPIHVEMARFEWYLEIVMDKLDGPYLTIDDLSKIPPEKWINIGFTVHPSVTMTKLYSNVPMIWAAYNNEEKEIPAPEFADTPKQWVFWRYNTHGYYLGLTNEQYAMFNLLLEGKSFGEICEELCENMQPEEVAQFAGVTLRNWIADGIISTVIEN